MIHKVFRVEAGYRVKMEAKDKLEAVRKAREFLALHPEELDIGVAFEYEFEDLQPRREKE